MIIECAGECGRRLCVTADDRIYLCRRCWKALFSVLFRLVRRGREVFTVVEPAPENLS